MRYMMLIHAEPDPDMPDKQMQEIMQGYYAFSDEVRQAGVLDRGEALQHGSTATTVRVRDGDTLTTDGPFAETKEQLGGFYILDCKNLDQAIEYAAKIPDAARGAVEIRPIMEIPDAG